MAHYSGAEIRQMRLAAEAEAASQERTGSGNAQTASSVAAEIERRVREGSGHAVRNGTTSPEQSQPQKSAYNPMEDIIMTVTKPKTPQRVTVNAAFDAWHNTMNTLANERKEKEAQAKAEAEQKEYKQLQAELDRIDASRAYVTTTEQSDELEKERKQVVERMRELGGSGTSTEEQQRSNSLANTKLAIDQGLTQVDHRIAQTADWLLGGIAKEGKALLNSTLQSINPEWGFKDEDPWITRYNKRGEAVIAANEQEAQRRIGEGTLNKNVWNYAPQVVAAVPDAVLALMSGGSTAAAQASTKTLTTAQPIVTAVKSMASSPTWLSSFAQSAGSSYNSAIAEGATEEQASLYALLNGFANATIEVGGGDEALGGIQKLPQQIQKAIMRGDSNLILKWAKNIASEAGEEVTQGITEKALRGVYANNVPLYSTDDENAVINPARMKEEAISGAIVSAILGGGQMALQAGANGGVAKALPTKQQSTHKTGADILLETVLGENAQRSAQQPQASTETQEGNSTPAAPANVKQGGSDELNTASAVNGGDVTADTQSPAQKSLVEYERLANTTVEHNGKTYNMDSFLRAVDICNDKFGSADLNSVSRVLGLPYSKTQQLLKSAVGTADIRVNKNGQLTATPGLAAETYDRLRSLTAKSVNGTQAVEQQKMNIDNTASPIYNNANGTTGGASNVARTGVAANSKGVPGVYQNGNADNKGRRGLGGVSVDSGLVLLSGESQNILKERGVAVEVKDTSADKTAFSASLAKARESDAAHGWAVTPKSAQELTESGAKLITTQDGAAGLAVAKDGDIEAVYSNKAAGAPKGVTKSLIPIAIANGSTKLDCYGEGLVWLYSQYGFVPVAKVKFNSEYANPGWDASKGTPDIYFMMHNGDSADTVVAKTGNYNVPTDAELAALPTMDYDKAYAYRDSLINNKRADSASQVKPKPDSRGYQPTLTETTLNSEVPQARGIADNSSAEAPASTTSIPTTAQNVKGENGGNAGGAKSVFEPTYNREAKPYTREKLSQFWSNTLKETESAAGVSEDVSRPLSYLPKTEKQSLGEAASRLSADRQGEIERLVSAEAWSGAQVDMAAAVASDIYSEAKTTGNYEAYTAWRKVMQEHITSGGQGMQALAKYSRHSGEAALNSIAETIADSNLTPQQRTELINRVGEYAERFDKITRGIPDTDTSAARGKTANNPTPELVSLIEDMARARGTWTFTNNTYSKLLKKQSDAYLKEYAYQQLLGMGNDKLVKTSVADKVKAVQSMAQLSSVATFARNIGGNLTFGAVDTMTQDGFGVALDWLLSKATGKRTVGFDAGWLSSEARKGAVDAMQKSILEVAGDVDMGGVNRYGQSSGRAFKMDGSPVERFFSRWQQLLGYSLTTSDKFSRGAIEAEQTRGLNAIKNSGLTSDETQALAQSAANYRLFQNQGIAYSASKATHDFLNLAGFGGKVGKATRQGGFGLGDFVNTYPGVPANFGVKVLEYSPANVIKGGIEMVNVIIKAKQGKLDVVKQQQAVMDVARGLAGVPAFALFGALTKAGFIRNWDDEDDLDVRAQNAAEGKTGIQWNLSGSLRYLKGDKSLEWRNDDKLVSIGWLEPINGFMAVGSLMANEPEDASVWAYVGDIAEGAIQAFLDIPVMSNISSMVDTFNYSKADSTMGKVGEAAVTYGGDLATSFIPSVVRGVAKGLDPYYRDTRGDTAAETALNRIKLAIPGLRETLPVKLDNFGQPKMYSGNTFERLADTLINPGTRTTIRQSEASKVLEDLYKATGDAGIYPDRKAPSSIKLDEDDESTRLTTAEKRLYQRTAGDLNTSLIKSLADNSLYNAASDEDKASIVKGLLSYSDDVAKKQYAQRKGAEFTSSWDKVFDADIPDVPDYVASEQALKNAKNKPEKADYSYLDKVIDNYGLLSTGSKELLRDSGLSVANLLYADSKGIDSEEWYTTHAAAKEHENEVGNKSDWVTAEAIGETVKGSDEEKLKALETEYPPADDSNKDADKHGKRQSIVRRYNAAINEGISWDDWTAVERAISESDASWGAVSGKYSVEYSVTKALREAGYSKSQASYIWYVYEKANKETENFSMYDYFFVDSKKDDNQSAGYKAIMDSIGVKTAKTIK